MFWHTFSTFTNINYEKYFNLNKIYSNDNDKFKYLEIYKKTTIDSLQRNDELMLTI